MQTSNPKYDNDLINYGFLKEVLKDSKNIIQEVEELLPKSYNSPPSTPYNKGSLLSYDGKLFQCVNTRQVGLFDWNDWKVIATDDTTVKSFIENTYSIDKIQIQEQMDNKIESYYQADDPATDWSTDIIKKGHVGDYWYNISDNTQWRYCEKATNPITYAWSPVDIPVSVYDKIDTKKSIYTNMPNSYKKDDMWIIEDNLDPQYLPNDVVAGDWVFAIQDSDTFNKEHWIKKDNNVDVEYLEQHYYTTEVLESKFEELDRSLKSDIKKSEESIQFSVEQTYATKEETKSIIKDYDQKIGETTTTIEKQGELLTNLSVENGQIRQDVQSTASKVESLDNDTKSNFESLTNAVNQLQTDTYTKTEIKEIITGTAPDGTAVTTLKNQTATFDIDGMHYGSNETDTDTIINSIGMQINDSNKNNLLKAGIDEETGEAIVKSRNSYIERYSVYGNNHTNGDWRSEVVYNKDYGYGLCYFYIGGNKWF